MVRVLNHVQQFAAGPGEPPSIIDGLLDSTELFFRNDVREWAEATLPSIEPEPIQFRGLVKSGNLGSRVSFRIYDGNRVVAIDPDAEAIPTLKKFFGQVVILSGIAKYNNTGAINKISDINSIEAYAYTARLLRVGNRTLHLNKPIRYDMDTDDRGSEFLASCQDLDIYAYGDSLNGAVNAANEEFIAIWDSIGNAPEKELHESALPLRRKLLEYVGREDAANGEHSGLHGQDG